MAHKLIAQILILCALLAGVCFAQENVPYNMTSTLCPGPAICCAVPVPTMTQPVPGGTPTVVAEAAVVLYGVHVSNLNTPLATPTPTPPAIPTMAGTPTATPTGTGTPTATPTPTPTVTATGTPTPTATPSPGWQGVRYLQLFDANAQPAAGSTPLGSSSWIVNPGADRDVHIGDKRGWAFTAGIQACCSITQGTFTPSSGCGFELQWYK